MYTRRSFSIILPFLLAFSGAVAHAQSATFTSTLMLGSSGPQVVALQQILNRDPATQVASSGAGSPGEESSYFGPLTKAAVMRFQTKYASQVLTPAGLTQATGVVGSYTRAFLNTFTATTSSTPVSTPTQTTPTTSTPSAPTQTTFVNTGAVIGVCGSANNSSVTSAPSTNLCASGTASYVVGIGPWSWTCAGSSGGTTASCSTQSVSAPSATTLTPSPSGLTIPTASQIIDSALNTWTLSGGTVYKNNGPAGFTVSVILLLYYNGTIYNENSSQNWQMWTGGGWASVSADPRLKVVTITAVCGTSPGVCTSGTPTAVSYGAITDTWNCQGSSAATSLACSVSAAR